MAFPDDPLAIKVELQLAGTWTDVSSYVSDTDAVKIARGIADEAGSADPATCKLTLENRDGQFSPRNPLSAYYGQLTRNTPLRVSVDQGDRSLDMLGLSTSLASTPDAAGLELSFDVDWRIDLEPDAAGWPVALTASGVHLVSKWAESGSQRSWAIFLQNDNTLRLYFSGDGSTTRSATSTAAIDTTQKRLCLRVVQQGDNGAGGTNVSFWTADSIAGPFVQLGSTVVVSGGAASWFDGTAPLEIGYGSESSKQPGFVGGRVHSFQLRTGIAASFLAVDADFSQATDDAAEFTDPTGHVWTFGDGARVAPSGIRFVGEVASWPPRWEPAGRDVWAPIEAAGILRRLQQGATPVTSSMRRAIMERAPALEAYWPMEDGPDSRAFASPLPDVRPMRIKGNPELAAFAEFAASAPIPTLNDAQFVGDIPLHEGSGAFQVRFLLNVPESTSTGNEQSICLVRTSNFLWHLAYMTDPNPGSLRVEAFDNEGNLLYSSGGLDFSPVGFPNDAVLGKSSRLSLQLQQDGSNINIAIKQMVAGRVAGGGTPLTATGTLGKGLQVVINNGGGIEDFSVGHVSYQSTVTGDITDFNDAGDIGDGLDAYELERAGDRIIRLAGENGVAVRVVGNPADTVRMGPQRAGTLVELLTECAAADGGLLFDDREMAGLTYRTRASLYNRSATLTLDYAEGDVGGSLEPVDDDQDVRNDVTVTRTQGSGARVELTSGPLSTAPPPDGVGRVNEDVELNVASDSDTLHRAGWRLHLTTVDETRYPTISANLRDLAADTALVPDAVSVDAGDRIAVTNPPAWLPPQTIAQVVQGYTETLGNWERMLQYVCTPASPFNVAELGTARYAPSAASLAAGVDADDTSLSVATSSGPLWTTDVADMPLDVLVGGERMTVTAISGVTSPQTFTVTRSVNGISKSHALGTAVALAEPSYRAL